MGDRNLLIHYLSGVGNLEEIPVSEHRIAERFLRLCVHSVDGEVASWWGAGNV